MRLSNMVGKRLKEDPKDSQMVSHKFLIRGAYIRQLASGTYSFLPLGERIKNKIENIIRKHMDRCGGQEVSMPVVHPAELWKESGRYSSIDESLLRFTDRAGKDNVLAMTHEEAAVHLVRTEISSYKQLPFMIYQIQTKFRDEARSRGGLIRVREFTMKDAYSFHSDEESLSEFYSVMHDAYDKIFKESGLKNFVSVKSDSGIMGGGISHEFMSVNEMGEDTLILCSKCDYKANKEIAECRVPGVKGTIREKLEKVSTPGAKTIDALSDYLGIETGNTLKALFYKTGSDIVFVIIRGDRELNETKLRNYLKTEDLLPADEKDIRGIGSVPGYASPYGLDSDGFRLIIDESVDMDEYYICGANEEDYHLSGFKPSRDLHCEYERAGLYSVEQGDLCPICGEPLEVTRGIEIGNIFQLGTKYSEPMNAVYLDDSGRAVPMIMASYGIGVGRLMSTIIEDNHDKYGPIWPLTVSPFEVHLNALKLKDEEVKQEAEKLYLNLMEQGIDVLFDDRDESPGSQFNDADLMGIPFRLIVSRKNIDNGIVEFKRRGNRDSESLPLASAVEAIKDILSKEYDRY